MQNLNKRSTSSTHNSPNDGDHYTVQAKQGKGVINHSFSNSGYGSRGVAVGSGGIGGNIGSDVNGDRNSMYTGGITEENSVRDFYSSGGRISPGDEKREYSNLVNTVNGGNGGNGGNGSGGNRDEEDHDKSIPGIVIRGGILSIKRSIFARLVSLLFYIPYYSIFIVKNALLMLLVYTVLTVVYDNLFVFPFYYPLDLSNAPPSHPSSAYQKPTYTVFMVSKNRDGYKRSAKPFVDKLEISPGGKFILFDIESDPPLELPEYLKDDTKVKIIRKEKDLRQIESESSTWYRVSNIFGKNSLQFSIWESWAFAMKHIDTDRIFYFDNCNLVNTMFHYSNYLDPGKSYMFANNKRYYTQNFATDRHTFLQFLRELPPHLIQDRRSFFGGDQLLIWYLDSEKSPELFGHIDHEELAAYAQWNPHSITIWRIFLYMNRYSHPVNGGNMQHYYCNDKASLCAFNGLVMKGLRLWGIYHIAEALLRLEVLFAPVPILTNVTGFWTVGFTFVGILNVIMFACWWKLIVFAFRAIIDRKRKNPNRLVFHQVQHILSSLGLNNQANSPQEKSKDSDLMRGIYNKTNE